MLFHLLLVPQDQSQLRLDEVQGNPDDIGLHRYKQTTLHSISHRNKGAEMLMFLQI